jgi:2-polyprenyl-6-methoxyphenol hydroxylase-like FAD-dependent oxidoreductase
MLPKLNLGLMHFIVQSRTLETLKIVGIVNEVLAEAVENVEVQAYKLPGGTERLPMHEMFPKQRPTPAVPYVSSVDPPIHWGDVDDVWSQPNPVAIGQDILERILTKSLLDRFGVKVEYGTELLSLESINEQVTAHLQRTSPDGVLSTEVAEAMYIVGTDGGRSRVRKELGLAFEGETLPGAVIIGDVQLSGLEPLVSESCSRYYSILTRFSLGMLGLVPTEGTSHFT